MATVYSLICFGGRSGKTVTFTTSGSVVNLNYHGLRDGAPVIFSTSGALPTGLTAGVTYYAKQGADANKFTLWTTSALTTQKTFSTTGSGTHTAKGGYFSGLTSGQLLRYGTAGSERIFDGMAAWRTHRIANASPFDQEILEIGEAWTDYVNPGIQTNIKCGSLLITSRVDGVRSAAWHGGGVGAGYILNSYYTGTGLSTGGYNQTFDGFTVKADNTYVSGITATNVGATIANMIAVRTIAVGQYGIYTTGAAGTRVFNCIATGFASGFYTQTYMSGLIISNNLFYGNTTGVDAAASSSIYGFYYNNISIGNTTNWKALPTGIEGATNNAGLSSDSPWQLAGGTSIAMATTDFANYAGGDFRPASSSSPQVDTGLLFYGAPTSDILDAEVPNYNNGGAEAVDVGCFEFNHGYGNHPATFTLTLTNVVIGSAVQVEDQAGTTTLHNETASAGTVVIPITVTGTALDSLRIKVRKGSGAPYYRPFETLTTAFAGAQTIYIAQQQDD